MTLAATRRYAFGASVLIGLAATALAVILISVLLSDPQQVVLAMTDSEFGSLLHLVGARLLSAVRALLALL